MIKKITSILIIFGLLLPIFSFAELKSFKTPETLEEAKQIGEKTLEITQKEMPSILEKLWKEDVLPVWNKMYQWFIANIWPKIEKWFRKEIEPRIKEEAEKRKSIIEEELQKEKEEIKKEAPEIGRTLWEKFKELIK